MTKQTNEGARVSAPAFRTYAQGSVIVEPDPIDGGLFLMLPSGDVLHAPDADGAEAIARGYFEGDLRRAERIARVGLIGIGRIEWRDGSREVRVETAPRRPRYEVIRGDGRTVRVSVPDDDKGE